MTMRPASLPIYVLAFTLGVASGYLDVITAEVFFMALVVLALSMLLGVLWPRRSWLLGILIGLGVPTAHWLAGMAHIASELPNHIGRSFLLLVPALVGAIGGGAMRYMFERLRES
jgi:hypothetical protein